MKSTIQKLAQCAGLIDTTDVTPWENGFLKGLADHVESEATVTLSQKQLEVLDRIYSKHFA